MPAMTPRRAPRRLGARATAIRLACLAIAAGSLAGLVFVGTGSRAAANVDSSITIAWTGDASAASADQPARDPSSPHYAEFKNLAVTVSQSQALGDQAVTVNVSGFSGTRAATDELGRTWTNAMNFVQAMQCWGDPSAANFRNTCEWGGRYVGNNGLGNTVYFDNVFRTSSSSIPADAANPVDVPFTTAGGTTVTGREVVDATGTSYPLLSYFGPDTSNELQSARIKSDGTGRFDFELQTADQAPQLGCGQAGHLRCWLVVVPRGTVYGGNGPSCSGIKDRTFQPYSYGRTDSIQAGSPLNPGCDYWDNRIVVPLDFNQVGVTCPSGGTEQRVIGSQLLVGAMASWQPALCTNVGATYSFAANPDSVARLQLLDKKAGLAFGSFPVVRSELDDPTAEIEYDATQLSYSPVAIGATTVSYFAEGANGRISSLNLSPRLVAKLLTQSYIFEIPHTAVDSNDNFAHLGTVNQHYIYLNQDPDFQALNANWQDFISNPALILPGPSGADALRQLWKWIQADDEARAWLGGAPDPWGMTVNPYYLPSGSAGAQVPTFDANGQLVKSGGAVVTRQVGLSNPDGTPMSIGSSTLDYFLKADETQVPLKLTIEKSRFDSIQFQPYTDGFLTAARQAFRADPQAKTTWDPLKVNAAGDLGDWVSPGPQIPGQRFVISISDEASTVRYALDAAALRTANGSDFVQPDEAGMTAALSALKVQGTTSVKQVDPASVTGAGYPLTTVVYATVNLSGTDSAARGSLAKMIRYIAGSGQTPGPQIGQLPAGYLPLTDELKQQASAAATAVENWAPPATTPPITTTTSNSGPTSGVDSSSGAGSTPGATSGPTITASAPDSTEVTPAVEVSAGRAGLAISLGFGVAGAIFAPLLFRGRGLL